MIKIIKKSRSHCAVAEKLNSILEKDQTKWSGVLKMIFYKREFYHEKIEKN